MIVSKGEPSHLLSLVLHCQHMKKEDITNTELLGAISKGFTAVEDKMDNMEQRLGQKIDSVRASLDSEIIRRADEHGVILKRLDTLEALHGISHNEKQPLAV